MSSAPTTWVFPLLIFIHKNIHHSSISTTTLRLPNLLVNRLFLNLRSFNRNNELRQSSALPEPVFDRNRVLGDVGAPLDHGWWDSTLDPEIDSATGDGRTDGAEAASLSGNIEGNSAAPALTTAVRARDATSTLVPVVSLH